jgi:hypothetical protein
MNGASRLNFRPLGRPGDVTRACECEATLSPEADVDPQGRATSEPSGSGGPFHGVQIPGIANAR